MGHRKPIPLILFLFMMLLLLCETAASWETQGRLREWDAGTFRPYDVEVLGNGSAWLTYFEGGIPAGSLLRFNYWAGPMNTYTLSGEAHFQTLDAAPDGTLWIADSMDRIVQFDPETGVFTPYPLDPLVFTLPAQPFGITVGPDGAVWFTCWTDPCLGRFDPGTGAFERFGGMPATPVEIAFGPGGNAWFTLRGPVGTPGLGRYDPVAHAFSFWTDPEFIDPFGIVFRGNDPWFLDHHANLLVRFSTFNMTFEKIPIPVGLTDAHFLVADPEGTIWFTAYVSGALGAYNRLTDVFTTIPLEDPDSSPMGIALHPSGWICWAETFDTGKGGVGVFFVDPATALFSPRTSVNHGGASIKDDDLGSVALSSMYVHSHLDGGRLNLHCIDADDEAFDPDTGHPLRVLSLREDSLLYSPVSGCVFVRKNDLVAMDLVTHAYTLVFQGTPHNVPGIDAVAVLENGEIVFSPDKAFYCTSPNGPTFYVHEDDLVLYSPDAQVIIPFYRPSFLGSLDAVDIYGGKLYFSVKDPIYIDHVPDPFYLEDGDVGAIDLLTPGAYPEFKFKGSHYHIYDMDAFSLVPRHFIYGIQGYGGENPPSCGK